MTYPYSPTYSVTFGDCLLVILSLDIAVLSHLRQVIQSSCRVLYLMRYSIVWVEQCFVWSNFHVLFFLLSLSLPSVLLSFPSSLLVSIRILLSTLRICRIKFFIFLALSFYLACRTHTCLCVHTLKRKK